MSKIEVRDELLNENLKVSTVDAARSFLESCTCSTQALRALMAAMCELEQVSEVEQLQIVLPAIAIIEAGSL